MFGAGDRWLNDYWPSSEWYRVKPKYSVENLPQCHFAKLKSHIDSSEIEPVRSRWETVSSWSLPSLSVPTQGWTLQIYHCEFWHSHSGCCDDCCLQCDAACSGIIRQKYAACCLHVPRSREDCTANCAGLISFLERRTVAVLMLLVLGY